MTTQFNAMILPLPGGAVPIDPMPTALPSSVGVCFSGGGSRALSCAMGQLRGLRHLGLLDQTFALSSVSGGTWASSAFTYLPATISDDDFLGGVELDPGAITIWGDAANALDHLTPNNLGRVPTTLDLLTDIDEVYRLWDRYSMPINDLWQALIGDKVLRPFGLWNPDSQGFDGRYITWNSALRDAAIHRNPSLREQDFITIERQRPFLVMNTSLFPDAQASADLLPFEANFSLGVRPFFPAKGAQTNDIGGGLLESFAFTGDYLGEGDPGYVRSSVPARAYSMSDIVGCSSAAFAQKLEDDYSKLSGLVPRYNYWPLRNRGQNPAQTLRFADGGSLENLGVNAMLARGMRRLVVFVNTDEAVSREDGEVVVSSDIPPLFGLQPYVKGKGYMPYGPNNPGHDATRMFGHSKVFAEADFNALTQGLWSAKQSGGSLMFAQTLTVLPNAWFGVEGGYPLDVLWIYNDRVSYWWEKLHWDVRAFIDAESVFDFPRYGTITQLGLSRFLVNALAHLSCWNVASDSTLGHPPYSNADMLQRLYAGK